jgi:mRNA interferase MazF
MKARHDNQSFTIEKRPQDWSADEKLALLKYNQATGLIICCPVSSSIRGGLTEVSITNLDQPSVVAASLVQTLSWRERKAKLIIEAEEGVIDEVLLRLLPLIGAEGLFHN